MIKWLNRDFIRGPYLALATSEKGYHSALRHCKVPQKDWASWVAGGADATTHVLTNADGGMVCLVCICVTTQESIQVAAMLVHEAVHVWQKWCEKHGENSPSEEFEAYSIQTISQRLMYAYADTLKGKT